MRGGAPPPSARPGPDARGGGRAGARGGSTPGHRARPNSLRLPSFSRQTLPTPLPRRYVRERWIPAGSGRPTVRSGGHVFVTLREGAGEAGAGVRGLTSVRSVRAPCPISGEAAKFPVSTKIPSSPLAELGVLSM
ncbi:hypothetical protein GCM10010363_41590 [Streptomyces omiyaensis]|nr:hypothetical protein GCM10010363_41590 [Streptomyces omiyaensis]